MSDLYLVLRDRLNTVTEWVELGAERIGEAQKARGLSDERVARQIPISTRTWIRWRQRGAVPVHNLEAVATILGLEIQRAAPVSITLPALDDGEPPSEYDARLERVEALVQDVAAAQQEVLVALRKLLDQRGDQRRARGGNGGAP